MPADTQAGAPQRRVGQHHRPAECDERQRDHRVPLGVGKTAATVFDATAGARDDGVLPIHDGRYRNATARWRFFSRNPAAFDIFGGTTVHGPSNYYFQMKI